MNPRVTVVRTLPANIDARIAGPLSALIGMTDGSYDGDALFFSRDIEIDGDMEAVVALRNAIDDSRVDFLKESVAWFGPLAAPIERILRSLVGAPATQREEMGVEGGGQVMELICPAGTPAALHDAVGAGADAIYCGFNDETNARNFPGLNFSREEMRESIAHAHRYGASVLVAINTFARAGNVELWQRAVDDAVEAEADALILADVGVMDYCAQDPSAAAAARLGAGRGGQCGLDPVLRRQRSTPSAWCCRACSACRRSPRSPAR